MEKYHRNLLQPIGITLSLMLVAACLLVGLGAGTAVAAGLSTQVETASQPMTNTPGTATNATAQCPSGTSLLGGGIDVSRAADTNTPANGLKVNGTVPSDAAGNPVANGSTDPASWTAVGGFGGQSEAGDQVTSFAMCSTGGPAHTVVATATVTSVATQGNPPLIATASCPSGTSLVGGGALGTPPSEPSFKPIASYPSNSSGVASANGDQNPTSWSAYGSAGVPAADEVTSAFAVCSTDTTVQTQVARVDATGPQTGGTFTTSTVSCPSGTLVDGGASADQTGGVEPQQGVHLRGSYPSDASAAPVANGAQTPSSWSAIVQAGGQNTPGTNVHVFALCGTVTAPASADLAITKTGPASVTTGGSLSYTLTATDNGPSDATGVTVTDTLPGGVTFVSASPGCTNTAGTVTCSVGSLANGASATITIAATAPSAPGTITNTATIAGNEADPNTANNTASATTTVTAPASADLAITKTGPASVTTGGSLSYTLTSTDNGPATATGVIVKDTLPPGVSFKSASSTQGTCSTKGSKVTCNVGTLASGASAVITIKVTAPSKAGSITNTATVKANQTDPNTANNAASATTTVTTPPSADLSITKTGPSSVTAGSNITYTMTVKNNGPSPASGVTVTDPLPAGVTFVSASPGCTYASGTVTCSIGNLAKGGSATITVVVNAPLALKGKKITNTATVKGNEIDPNTRNNKASVTTSIK